MVYTSKKPFQAAHPGSQQKDLLDLCRCHIYPLQHQILSPDYLIKSNPSRSHLFIEHIVHQVDSTPAPPHHVSPCNTRSHHGSPSLTRSCHDTNILALSFVSRPVRSGPESFFVLQSLPAHLQFPFRPFYSNHDAGLLLLNWLKTTRHMQCVPNQLRAQRWMVRNVLVQHQILSREIGVAQLVSHRFFFTSRYRHRSTCHSRGSHAEFELPNHYV